MIKMGWFKRKSEGELQSEIAKLSAKKAEEERYGKLQREYSALKNRRLNEFGQRMGRGTSRFGSAIKSLAQAQQKQRPAQRKIKGKRMPIQKPFNYSDEMQRMMMR